MKIGVRVPCYRRWCRAPQVRAIAAAAEELGFASLWVQDHLVAPTGPREEVLVEGISDWMSGAGPGPPSGARSGSGAAGAPRPTTVQEYYAGDDWWLEPYVTWGYLAALHDEGAAGERHRGRAVPEPPRASQDAGHPRRALRRAHDPGHGFGPRGRRVAGARDRLRGAGAHARRVPARDPAAPQPGGGHLRGRVLHVRTAPAPDPDGAAATADLRGWERPALDPPGRRAGRRVAAVGHHP